MRKIRGGVELSVAEDAVHQTYLALLRKDHQVPRAAIAALTSQPKPWGTGRYSHLFVAWLSDGTVEWPDRARPPTLSAWGRARAAKGMTHLADCTCPECK